MSYQPRILEKFEDVAGTISFTFPIVEYEYESDQELYLPEAALAGAHYGYDMLGTSEALKATAIERLRFDVLENAGPSTVDTKVDEMVSELLRCGRGKLYSIDSADVRRWAYARVGAMPSLRWSAGNIFHKTASVHFRRLSDWYGTTPIAADITLNEATETFSINNTGLARVYNAVFIFKGTYVNPELTNLTNGYILESSRDGSAAGHWLRFDCGKRRVEFSTNSGTSYSGDYANFVRQTGQVHFMVLEPGVNNFSCAFGGVPSGTLSYSLYPAFN